MSEIFASLVSQGVPFLVLPRPAANGVDAAARANGLDPTELVRTEVLVGARGPALVVVPWGRRVDLPAAREAVAEPTARRASPAELRAFAPMCDPDAIPPLASQLRAPLYVDVAVAARDQLVFAAGRSNVLVCVGRAELFASHPYVVAPLATSAAVGGRSAREPVS